MKLLAMLTVLLRTNYETWKDLPAILLTQLQPLVYTLHIYYEIETLVFVELLL